jgi:adenylosuccinate lyase
VAYGHSLLAYQRILRGLNKISVDRPRLLQELRAHPEVLAEAIQTILRRAGYAQPYEMLKQLTRGRTLTLEDLHAFLDTLQIDSAVREELRTLTPENYTGMAEKLAQLHKNKTGF